MCPVPSSVKMGTITVNLRDVVKIKNLGTFNALKTVLDKT